MRRSRRAGSSPEFGSSGEDSFVAVVVTKLTGALLFILLLTMVIMALIPKAVEVGQATSGARDQEKPQLAITTPGQLPDAVAGRPYTLALAAVGTTGKPRWSLLGDHPAWLELDEETGQLHGTPDKADSSAEPFVVRVTDRTGSASSTARISVLVAEPEPTLLSWAASSRAVPWQAWAEQGVGFLILWLVHLVGMNAIAALERSSHQAARADLNTAEEVVLGRRFSHYRWLVRLGTLGVACGLGIWLVWPPGLVH